MTETMMIFMSVTTSFIFLSIGVLFGWVAAEVKLLSVRFVDEDEIEEE